MPPFRSPILPTRTPLRLTLLTLSIPTTFFALRAMSTTTGNNPSPQKPPFPTRPYRPQHATFPYAPSDFLRADESSDTDFYASPRFVTHIDDHAIELLKEYYRQVLPRKGRVLDLCSSWVSHFPAELEEVLVAAREKNDVEKGDREGGDGGDGGLEVIGLGMNKAELDANPILQQRILQDLNTTPEIPRTLAPLSATTCVVSIDYLTRPLAVLTSLFSLTRPGGTIHLIISNRCFPTKAIGRWLRISEQERLQMVGDYLHFSGWTGVEVVELCDGRGEEGGLRGFLGMGTDPVWVVRGVKGGEQGEGERSEL